jgi:menaquinone-dependent protoporphyrinogen oxidase
MGRILVAYATMAGSTAEVARTVGEELAKSGFEVDVLPLGEVKDIRVYEAVAVGGPMIMGWHRAALRFLKAHRDDFQHIPLAVFILAMSLTQDGETGGGSLPVYVDEKLPKPPEKAGSLNFRERYARLSHYLDPILKATRPVKPASIGVFGGRMEYGRLKWWAVIFAMLIIRAPAGDKRNWPAIREWSAGYAAWLREHYEFSDSSA